MKERQGLGATGAGRELRAWLLGRSPGFGVHMLAARLPGGTGWSAREVPMWKRSDVERLTGLTRHMIQDLCNPNTTGDGLGFWEPAISKQDIRALTRATAGVLPGAPAHEGRVHAQRDRVGGV